MENCNLHEMYIKKMKQIRSCLHFRNIFSSKPMGEIKKRYKEYYGGTLSPGLWD